MDPKGKLLEMADIRFVFIRLWTSLQLIFVYSLSEIEVVDLKFLHASDAPTLAVLCSVCLLGKIRLTLVISL